MSTRTAPAPAARAEPARSTAAPARASPSKVQAARGPAPYSTSARLQGGSPLPVTLRARMERAFDRSFDGVRVHTGGAAAHLTREHDAEAVTIGSDIAFGEGRFRPETAPGQHLVAHELAHVAQQGGTATPSVQARSTHSVPGEPAEVAAESAAGRAVRGERVHVGAVDYSLRGRLMRRARRSLSPPPNPAPLAGRVSPPAAAAPGRAPDRAAMARAMPTTRAAAALDEVATARPAAATALLKAVAPPAPRKSGAEGETQAQAETEDARDEAKKVVEEEAPAPAPAAGEVPSLAGGAAAAAAPPSVVEPPSTGEADKKEEAQAASEAGEAGEEAKKEEGGPEGEAAPEDRAPASPAEDPAFRRVIARGRTVARAQAHNNTAKRKAAEAQAAAPGPANEVEAMAGGNQVAKMAEQEPAPFDKESFKAALIAKINEIAPGTLEDADEFKSRGSAGALKSAVVGEVETGKEGAQGPIKETAEEAPSTAGVEPKPVTPQPPTEAGAPPPDIGGAGAAPKPKTDAEVNLDAGPQSIEDKMAEAKVTDQTLATSHEPAFESALEEKDAAKEHAETAPVAYREAEAGIVGGARGDAASTAEGQTGAMYDSRVGQFEAVQGEQDATQTGDTDARTLVTDNIKAIFDETQAAVQDRLTAVDEEVNTAFDAGAESARQEFEDEVEREKEAYKDRRYSGIDGAALWVRDLFLPLPDEVNQIYQTARQNYINAMSTVIDEVATIVETGLNDAMARVEEGRQAVTDYVSTLEGDLKTVGESAAANIQAEFDSLTEEVKNAEQQMIAGLAQKYVDNLKAIDERIEAMQEDDKGLVGKAMDAIEGVIDTILELKEMLLGILAKAADVIEMIIADPIGFLGNLVTGIKMGLQAFVANIGEHLKSGLMGWLFGAVAAAGITMPESFDLKGLLSLGAQILGLTYANFRARAVRIVGEPIVQAMETAVEIIRILMTEGIAGVWSYIKDMLGNLVDTVLETIRNWVITKVITAGITWILSLLNPASAFVRACKMIIDVVMFFIERGSQIVSLVNAVLDSISAIASGALGAMASAVEGALARAVPVAISFLASLLGLGGVSEMIRGAIEKIQAPVNKAIDWLIGKAVKIAKSIGGLFGKKKPREEDTPAPGPEADLGDAQAAAAAALSQRLGPDTSVAEANAVIPEVRRELTPVGLKSLVLQPGDADGEFEIYAESSPRQRVARLVRKRITVAISATITMRAGEAPLAGLARPRGPGRYDFGEDITFRDVGEERAEALGGTGRLAPLPPVPQPPGTAARKGSQPSAGVIVEPAPGSSTLEVLAWNTSAPERGHNVSHAERQFVNWFEDRPFNWHQRVQSVNIHVDGRPVCPDCEADLRSLQSRFPAITFTWTGAPATTAEALENQPA